MLETRQTTTPDDVRAIPPARGDGPQWEPVTHKDLIDRVTELLTERGWTVDRHKVHLNTNASAMAWGFDVLRPDAPPAETVFAMGFVHSNNRRIALKMYGGLRLPAGGVPLDEYPLGKHTADAVQRLQDSLHLSLVAWARESRKYEVRLAKLDSVELNPSQSLDLLTTAADAGLTRWSRVGQIQKLYRAGPPTCWQLLRCFAQVHRKDEPIWQLQRGHTFVRMAQAVANKAR